MSTIHLTLQIDNVDELEADDAYGADALGRWESSATINGVYVEGGTFALVGTTDDAPARMLYDVWDPDGSDQTWYRTRVSNAAGTKFSPYSAPFQPATAELYLTLTQARGFVPTWLGDPELLILMESAAKDIIKVAGPTGTITEVRHASGPLLQLGHQAAQILTVTEDCYGTATTLDDTDYELSSTGALLRRLRNGTHPAAAWRRQVRVELQQPDDLASRQRVQEELLKLAVAYNGWAGESTLNESRTLPPDYWAARESVLATLTYPGDGSF